MGVPNSSFFCTVVLDLAKLLLLGKSLSLLIFFRSYAAVEGREALPVKETLPELVEGAALSPAMTVREPWKGGGAKACSVELAKRWNG